MSVIIFEDIKMRANKKRNQKALSINSNICARLEKNDPLAIAKRKTVVLVFRFAIAK